MVLEASLGYTASCSVAAFDEVASVYERTDELDRRVIVNRDEISSVEQRLRERVRELEVRYEVERDLHREATRNVGSCGVLSMTSLVPSGICGTTLPVLG